MKHAELRSIVHNVADSLASGLCFVIGYFDTDVFGEAARSPNGRLTVDFLAGSITDGSASPSLCRAVALFPPALARLCVAAGGSIDELREAKVQYWADALRPRFTVCIEDARGRRSETEYAGLPGQRVKVIDAHGRLRPKPAVSS